MTDAFFNDSNENEKINKNNGKIKRNKRDDDNSWASDILNDNTEEGREKFKEFMGFLKPEFVNFIKKNAHNMKESAVDNSFLGEVDNSTKNSIKNDYNANFEKLSEIFKIHKLDFSKLQPIGPIPFEALRDIISSDLLRQYIGSLTEGSDNADTKLYNTKNIEKLNLEDRNKLLSDASLSAFKKISVMDEVLCKDKIEFFPILISYEGILSNMCLILGLLYSGILETNKATPSNGLLGNIDNVIMDLSLLENKSGEDTGVLLEGDSLRKVQDAVVLILQMLTIYNKTYTMLADNIGAIQDPHKYIIKLYEGTEGK